MLDIQTKVARRIFTAFLITFLVARGLVFLIMSGRLPDFYVYLGQTHVHHLNFGIVILSVVGGYLLLFPAAQRQAMVLGLAYGVGLGLTFDEFGMWFHLGGGYWQRASYDAIIVVGSVFSLISLAPSLKVFQVHHWAVSVLLLILLSFFFLLLVDSFRFASHRVIPKLELLDAPGERGP